MIKKLLDFIFFKCNTFMERRVISYQIGKLKNSGQDIIVKSGTLFIKPECITIGNNTSINRNCFFHAGGEIILGTYCQIASGVTMTTHNHIIGKERYYGNIKVSNIIIGNNVWIGANVTILPGVEIGDNSIIAAGSVVLSKVEKNCLYAGAPAVFKKRLNND